MEDNVHFHTEDNTSNYAVSLTVSKNSLISHGVYLAISRVEGRNWAKESTHVQGEDEIKRLLYTIAVKGGLIEEDGAIVVRKPEEPREIPEDGQYILTTSMSSCLAYVHKGKLFVPQKGVDGEYVSEARNKTEDYLKYDSWSLEKIKEK